MATDLLPPHVGGLFLKISKALWREYWAEQRDLAERILLDQVRRGKPWLLTEKQGAAALFTYLRAAQEGVARRNLELMAEALVTAAEEATFAPDEFRRYATRLADLSREEILITAEFIRCRREVLDARSPTPSAFNESDDAMNRQADAGAEQAQEDGQVWTRVVENLLGKPAIFPDVKLLHGYAGALTRTGWISYIGGWDDGLFRATPLLDVVERLLEWKEAAARAEDEGS